MQPLFQQCACCENRIITPEGSRLRVTATPDHRLILRLEARHRDQAWLELQPDDVLWLREIIDQVL